MKITLLFRYRERPVLGSFFWLLWLLRLSIELWPGASAGPIPQFLKVAIAKILVHIALNDMKKWVHIALNDIKKWTPTRQA